MIHYTKYANQKFDILNAHKVYFTREQIDDVASAPDKTGKKDGYTTCEKDGVKVILKKVGGVNKVITFFPVEWK